VSDVTDLVDRFDRVIADLNEKIRDLQENAAVPYSMATEAIHDYWFAQDNMTMAEAITKLLEERAELHRDLKPVMQLGKALTESQSFNYTSRILAEFAQKHPELDT
jgi:hypothetical protein